MKNSDILRFEVGERRQPEAQGGVQVVAVTMLVTARFDAVMQGLTPIGRDNVNLSPNAKALPGTPILQGLANGLGQWALIAAMIGIVVGGVLWAFGHYSQNYQQAYNGRKGVLVSGVAALLVGAAPMVINFFLNQGSAAK